MSDFADHLDKLSEIVESWPDWKKNIFGIPKPPTNEALQKKQAEIIQAIEAAWAKRTPLRFNQFLQTLLKTHLTPEDFYKTDEQLIKELKQK